MNRITGRVLGQLILAGILLIFLLAPTAFVTLLTGSGY